MPQVIDGRWCDALSSGRFAGGTPEGVQSANIVIRCGIMCDIVAFRYLPVKMEKPQGRENIFAVRYDQTGSDSGILASGLQESSEGSESLVGRLVKNV
jgi:hypothetical protein